MYCSKVLSRKVLFLAFWLVFFGLIKGELVLAQGDSTKQRDTRKVLLEELKELLPHSNEWEEWLKESGELPPDFSNMESIPFIPDPLRMQNSYIIGNSDQWPERRNEIMQLSKQYIIGHYPDAPNNIRVREKSIENKGNITVYEIVLEFGPNHKATLSFELILPPGEGPFPVFMTQNNHRRWAVAAVRRGYAGIIYAGSDSKDDTKAWISVYAEYDWTRLTRRAWAASRVIDYLKTLDYIDFDKIALAGHSRNGKASIIGGAIDKRIDAIISSSSGAAGALSFRSFSESEFGESVEIISRNFPTWVHPRLRFFTGREDKLPVDSPNLIAAIAPRPFLYAHALNDGAESIWALENSYRSAKRAYKLLNASDNIELLYRFGNHETHAEDIEQYIDWLDYHFGRSSFNPSNETIYPTMDDWRKNAKKIPDPSNFPERSLSDLMNFKDGSTISSVDDWHNKLKSVRKRIRNGLGTAPPYVISYPGSYGSERSYSAEMLRRSSMPNNIIRYSFNFGSYINGDIYVSKTALKENTKIPIIIWLHPISTAYGYNGSYQRGRSSYLTLANEGYAVFAFDLIGHGARLKEAIHFYDRYPEWTLLGSMVRDVKQAVNALMLNPLTEYEEYGNMDFIDTEQIFVLGYGMGGKVALHASALDERIAGAISVAGFTPMRLDSVYKQTGGLSRWSENYPLQPWLAEFIGNEAHVPYDYHEVLSAIAPRKATIIAPEINRQATLKDIRLTVKKAEEVFSLLNAGDNLQLRTPFTYNQFGPEMQEIVLKELPLLLNEERIPNSKLNK